MKKTVNFFALTHAIELDAHVRGKNLLLLTVVLLRALQFLPTLPLPDGGIPPMNGEEPKRTIKLKEQRWI